MLKKCALVICLCIHSVLFSTPLTYPLGVVIIDAGHGGHDPGAVRYEPQIYFEKDITLSIALLVAQLLHTEREDLSIVMTRESDIYVSLDKRAAIARYSEPPRGYSSLLVSIHANSSLQKEPSGYEVLIKKSDKKVSFLTKDSPQWELARYALYTMHALNEDLTRAQVLAAERVISTLNERFPTMRNRGIKEQDVFLLQSSAIPSILIEVGFLSNDEEYMLLIDRTWQETMAMAIVESIIAYDNALRNL